VSIADLLLGWSELEENYAAYLEAQHYAEGRVDEVFASDGQVAQKLKGREPALPVQPARRSGALARRQVQDQHD
jgi:hypothetical protein